VKVDASHAAPTVLIVAHEFPPIGGVGVQRPYKFAQYLPEFGWQPVILTQNARSHATWDESLLTLLTERKVPIVRATNPMSQLQHRMHLRRLKRQAKPTTPTATSKSITRQADAPLDSYAVLFSSWLKNFRTRFVKQTRQTLFIPDEAILWLPTAVAAGLRVIREQPIAAIYATSPPETTQLVAAILSDLTGIPLIADFRDPWIGNLHRSTAGLRHLMESDLETFVVSRATRVTTVTESFRTAFAKRYPHYAHKLRVIPNGYDSRDLQLPQKTTNTDQMVIYYGGILYEKRSPETFLRGLAAALEQGLIPRSQIKVRFAGVFDYPGKTANRDLVTALGLGDIVETLGYVPHAQHATLMACSDLLLVIGDQSPGAEAYVPAKVYEYLGAGKPILGVLQTGEASRLIDECQAGRIAPAGDCDAVAVLLQEFFTLWTSGQLADWQHSPLAVRYDRREQARMLAVLLQEMTDGQPVSRPQPTRYGAITGSK